MTKCRGGSPKLWDRTPNVISFSLLFVPASRYVPVNADLDLQKCNDGQLDMNNLNENATYSHCFGGACGECGGREEDWLGERSGEGQGYLSKLSISEIRICIWCDRLSWSSPNAQISLASAAASS